MAKPDFESAKAWAKTMSRRPVGHGPFQANPDEAAVSRAYLSLLEAVEPLLAAAEKATPGPWTWDKDEPWIIAPERESTLKPWFIAEPWEHGIYELEGEDDANAAFIATARNTASALRDLLGPTGGGA